MQRYIRSIPRKPLPPGVVAVHNHVRWQRTDGSYRVYGEDGFRFWIQDDAIDNPSVEECDCGWQAERLAQHYRVVRADV